MTTQCFLLTRTWSVRQWLRRYSVQTCPVHGSTHEGMALIGDVPGRYTPDGYLDGVEPPMDDPRWPTHCACGYAFEPDDDAWQVFQEPLWTAPDGRQYTTRPRDRSYTGAAPAPAGAMWDAWWISRDPHDPWCGPDGKALYVRLPDGGDWLIDGPSSSGGKWTRTGEPPVITARPSILTKTYHGWLTDGVLSDDLEGRTYP